MKKFIVFLIAATLLLSCYTFQSSQDTIVICSSMEQFRNEYLRDALEARFPEYHIVVMYMATGKAATKIAVEGEHTDVDMVVGLETGYLSKVKENLEDISGRSRIPYVEGLAPEDNGNLWVTWERQAGGIVINRKMLEEKGLAVPASYEDLLKSEYQGLVAMPDPKSSGTGYFFYKSWVNSMGEQNALDYADQLYVNLKQFTESGSGPLKLLIQGETAIGLGLTFQTVDEINKGMDFEIIFPETGSPYSLTGTAMIKGKGEKEGVSEVFDYIINEALIYDKEYFSPEKIYEGQENRIENYPKDIQYADMTGISDAEEKERLLGVWKY